MAGQLPSGSEGSILSFLQGGTPEQKREVQQRSALDQLIGTIGQEPRAMTPIGEMKASPALPDFKPSGPAPQTSRLPVPAFGDNKGLPGNFTPNQLPGEQRDLDTKRLALLGKAAPQLILPSLVSSLLPKTLEDKTLSEGQTIGSFDQRTNTFKPSYTAPKSQESFKVGATREVQIGDQKHTQEFQGNNIWKDIGTGPAYAPTQEPPPVEIDDPNSPTGKTLVPRSQAIGKAGPSSTTPQATANTLRDEFNAQTAPVRTVASMYRNGVKAAASASPAGDMGLIYSFMKALDPGSSVKEGEYAQGENLTGAYGKVWQSYNKAKDGEKLLPETRQDILGQLKNIYASHLPSYAATKQHYTDIATRQRVKPEDVVSDLPAVEEPTTTGAPKGAPSATDAQGNKIFFYGGKWQR